MWGVVSVLVLWGGGGPGLFSLWPRGFLELGLVLGGLAFCVFLFGFPSAVILLLLDCWAGLAVDFLSVLVVYFFGFLFPHENLGIGALLVFPCLCLPAVPVFGLLSLSCPCLSFLVMDPSGVSLLKCPLMFFQIFAFPVTW